MISTPNFDWEIHCRIGLVFWEGSQKSIMEKKNFDVRH